MGSSLIDAKGERLCGYNVCVHAGFNSDLIPISAVSVPSNGGSKKLHATDVATNAPHQPLHRSSACYGDVTMPTNCCLMSRSENWKFTYWSVSLLKLGGKK